MMEDDPFLGRRNDRTVLRPMPGGVAPVRAETAPPVSAVAPPRVVTSNPSPPIQGEIRWLATAGTSALLNAAGPLLSLGAMLRGAIAQGDVAQLRNEVARQLQTFERQARAENYPEATVLTARYLLCTFLDECVLRTPWGSDGRWSEATLLVTFHNEAWGGEKFFAVLDKLLETPERNLELLDIIYLCLAFGFQGRYGVQDGGEVALERRRQEVYAALTRVRGEPVRDLSPHWRGVKSQAPKLARFLPLWVVAAVAGVLLLLIYTGFNLVLSAGTEPLLERISALRP